MTIFTYAITFFLVANPIGNSPAIMALIKNFPFERQRILLIRESLVALIIALFFQYFGAYFLELIQVQNYTVSLCGGILLFIVAINMVFPPEVSEEVASLKKEPFLVPIATPLIGGPSLLTIIMLYSANEPSKVAITLGIICAWVLVMAVMATIPYLQRLLGERGLVALEQLMGLMVSFIAIEMIITGINLFKETYA